MTLLDQLSDFVERLIDEAEEVEKGTIEDDDDGFFPSERVTKDTTVLKAMKMVKDRLEFSKRNTYDFEAYFRDLVDELLERGVYDKEDMNKTLVDIGVPDDLAEELSPIIKNYRVVKIVRTEVTVRAVDEEEAERMVEDGDYDFYDADEETEYTVEEEF